MARRTDLKTTRRRRVRDDGWRLPDALWAEMEPLLPPRPKHPLGCDNPRVPDRSAMDAIFFVLRTGCQWNALRETTLCSSSSAHRRFQEWTRAGVLAAFWREGLLAYDALRGIDWTWLALDGAMGKAPLGGGRNRPEPDGPGQARGEALGADRRPRRAARGGDRRGQPQRPQADAPHPRGHPGPAAEADAPPPAAPLPRQGLRLRRAARPRRGVRLHLAPADARRGGQGQAPRPSQSAALGGGAHALLAAPLPVHLDPLGQEAEQLPRAAPLRPRHHHMAARPTGIGSK